MARNYAALIMNTKTTFTRLLFWLALFQTNQLFAQDEMIHYQLEEYPHGIKNPMKVAFEVTNTGSAPFYYPFPVEVALLDPISEEQLWGKKLEEVDIRNWQPGNFWNPNFNQYMEAPKEYKVEATLALDSSVKQGDYILWALPCID